MSLFPIFIYSGVNTYFSYVEKINKLGTKNPNPIPIIFIATSIEVDVVLYWGGNQLLDILGIELPKNVPAAPPKIWPAIWKAKEILIISLKNEPIIYNIPAITIP